MSEEELDKKFDLFDQFMKDTFPGQSYTMILDTTTPEEYLSDINDDLIAGVSYSILTPTGQSQFTTMGMLRAGQLNVESSFACGDE